VDLRLGTLPPNELLGLEPAEPIDEVATGAHEGVDGPPRPIRSRRTNAEDSPTLAESRLIPREVRKLIHQAELDRSTEPAGYAMNAPRPIEGVGRRGAFEPLDVGVCEADFH
jgi:hypothetical protein